MVSQALREGCCRQRCEAVMPNVPDFMLLSIKLEVETGFDSIPTIEEHYRHEPWNDETCTYKWDGKYECVMPSCGVIRHTAEAMWRHVHFTDDELHRPAFGVTSPNDLDIHKDYTPEPTKGMQWVKTSI